MTSAQCTNYPIIVHSHLRWDWVWQRPQQFLSRLSKRHRVLFVEGPEVHEDDSVRGFTLRSGEGAPNITVMRTHFPASRFGDAAWVDAERGRLVNAALHGPLKGKFDNCVQWFYDPMAIEAHCGKHGELATVYDCMDELSQFRFAPPELIARERRLLAHADVVFAGGRKIWESKSRYNSNAHFYGCGVDVAHFGKSRLASTQVPDDVAHLAGPVLGYFGVVDERLDYELIARLADANPTWNVVIIGPACKVDPADFPQRSNLHWLGARPYEQLPNYTKRFDVCLMPFALNEATEFINPTKALEYMATGTPIVSTAVPDVVSNFASVVKIGSPDEFITHCCKLAYTPDPGATERGLRMASENTWEAIVLNLERHIDQALAKKNLAGAVANQVQALYNPGLSATAAW